MAKSATSPLGRLLEEISWEGNARHYRAGGRGFENVLTAEVLQILEFLPRKAFLGRILRSTSGHASAAVAAMRQEVESIKFSILPGALMLKKSQSLGRAQLEVQPDAVLESPSVYCLVEAKRIRQAAFQPEQLAREYVAVVQTARERGRMPLLLLLLADRPPVPVKGVGRIEIQDAVSRFLVPVLERTDEPTPHDDLVAKLGAVVAHTTWPAISADLGAARDECVSGNESIDASLRRLVDSALNAIDWHGKKKALPNTRLHPTASSKS